MAKVRILRSKQFTEKLRKLRQNTQPHVRAALAEGARDIVAMAQRLVPDGPGTGERDLKGTIKWRFGAEEGGGSDAKTGRSAATTVHITAGDDKNPEARWIEFGTAPFTNEGIYKGTANPGITAQPYFFPAYRANKKPIKRAISQAIRRAIKEAVR